MLDLTLPGVEAFKEFIHSTVCNDLPDVCKLVANLIEAPKDQNPHVNQVITP